MNISNYVHTLEDKYGTLLGVDDDERLVVASNTPLPRRAAIALAGYASQVIGYFRTGTDGPLPLRLMEKDLEDLGLIRMPHGNWTHPAGDEAADLLITGILEPDKADVEAIKRLKQRWPPDIADRRQEIKAQEIEPGVYRWTEPKGVWAVPVFNGRRLLEK